jgi:DHA3 family macrolide efflux protein-like MFS transporter
MIRNRNFVLLWSAQCISAAGDTFSFLALAVRIDSIYSDPGQSAKALGAVLIAYALPVLLLGIFAGTLVDRQDRKVVMVLSDLARALLAPGYLLLRSASDLPLAMGFAFALAAFSVFFYPARTALVPSIVGKDQLMSANGWMQVGQTIARLSGPILAGLVVGRWGSDIAFWIDSASFLMSALLVLGIVGVTTRVFEQKQGAASAWLSLKEGVRFILNSRLLQGITLGIALAMLGIGAINVLFVPFLHDAFGVSPEALGGVQTAQGAGMLLGGLILGGLGKLLKPRTVAIISMVVLALGTVLFGAAPGYTAALLIIPLVGFSLPPLNASLQTLLQSNVPSELLGRAGSVMDMAISLANVVSMGLAGYLGAAIGLRQSFFAGGAFVFLGAVAMALMLPAARTYSDGLVPAVEASQAATAE